MPDGRRLRIRLETAFWATIDDILADGEISLPELIAMVEHLPGEDYGETIPLRLRRMVLNYHCRSSAKMARAVWRHQKMMAMWGKGVVIPFDEFQRRRGNP